MRTIAVLITALTLVISTWAQTFDENTVPSFPLFTSRAFVNPCGELQSAALDMLGANYKNDGKSPTYSLLDSNGNLGTLDFQIQFHKADNEKYGPDDPPEAALAQFSPSGTGCLVRVSVHKSPHSRAAAQMFTARLDRWLQEKKGGQQPTTPPEGTSNECRP